MGFNESGEYKKTFIGSGVAGSHKVQTQDLIYYHLARDKEQHSAHELLKYREDSNEAALLLAASDFEVKDGLKDDMDARSDVYVLSNGCRKCSDDSDGYYWEYTPVYVSSNGIVGTAFVGGHFILSVGAWLGMRYVFVGIVGISLIVDYRQTSTRYVDFDYAPWVDGITVYGLMILGCARSLKANLQHMEALSTTEAGYMMFIEAWKKIWLKGLLAQSGYELSLLAGIATGALVKGGSRSEVQAQNIGTSDYFALDVLLNCLTVLSSEYLGIQQVVVGGRSNGQLSRKEGNEITRGEEKTVTCPLRSKIDVSSGSLDLPLPNNELSVLRILEYAFSHNLQQLSISSGRYIELSPSELSFYPSRGWSTYVLTRKQGKQTRQQQKSVGSQEYQMVCTRLDIASADVGMLDKFDRGLQTDVQVFVDFDYAMAAYMTLTGAWKKEIWLKGLLAESGYELSLVAGIATGALVKGGSRSEVPAQVEGAAYRLGPVVVWMVFPRLDPGSTVLVDPGKTLYRKEAGKKAGCSDGKGRRYEKGGIVAIVEGEAHGGLGLRGGLLGVQTQSHIGRIIISKLTYKLGGLLLLSPIGFRMEPQLGLYVRLGDREAEVFQVSNDGTAGSSSLRVLWLTRIDQEEVFVVYFFWKEQDCSILFGLPGSRQQKFLVLKFFDVKEQQGKDEGFAGTTRINCLVKEQKKEYQTGWKIKTGNVLDSCNQRSTQQFWSVQGFWAEDTTISTYLVNRSPSSAIGFKTPIDMLGFLGWLAIIKQGILEPVKVVLYRNMGFNESGEYKKTFIGSGVGTGSMQVLQGDEFEVEPQDGHTFEVEPHGNVDHVVGSQEYREDSNEAAFAVAAVEKIYAHESLTFNNTVACEVISKWKAGLKDDMDARSDVYVLSNGYKKCSDDSDGYYWESTPVGSQEYQMVCTRLDIASADVGMLDKFDRGLQTDVQVFVDFDYAMAAYMTLTGAWKKEIWLKGLLAESGYELSLVAGIATGALVKGSSRSEVPAQVEGAAYRVIESYKWYQSSGSRVLWLTRIDQEEVFVVWFFWKEQEGSILFGLPGSRQQKFLVLRFFDVKEQQGIDRLNIEKLDGNIVQKHGGSKQVGFKQLGPGVETGVHGVHDEKRVWFEVELQGAQGDREAEVFQVYTTMYEECRVAKHLGVTGIQQQNGLVDEINMTHFAKLHMCSATVAGKAVTTETTITGNIHQAEIWVTKGLLDKAKGNVLGFTTGSWVQTLLEGRSILSMEGSLSRDCDVEKNGKWSYTYAVESQVYQGVCTRPDIASADVGMYDRMPHMMALLTTEAGCMTFIKAWKKEAIWLRGLLEELGVELNRLYPPSDDVIVISSDDKDDEEKDIPLDDEDDIASTPVQIQVPEPLVETVFI
ncbi:zinc finger, CCHC-type containing protein [Tanacetum coccineum]|uniref:Zinc finger, CCHC-type containing protein n=1 Tax=Tanacetum coccineum TaxID=301880 RepID=A0ABQ5F6B9_9ASTR